LPAGRETPVDCPVGCVCALAVALAVALVADGDTDADADGNFSVGTGTGATVELVVVVSATDTAVELDEEAEAQPAAPQATKAVTTRQGHRTDRVRFLAGLPGLREAVISDDIGKKRRT